MPAPADATLRRYAWWDVFYLVTGIAMVVFAVLYTDGAFDKAASVALLAAMALWYWFLGRRVILWRLDRDRYTTAYVVGLIVLYAAYTLVQESSTLVLMALSPMVFWLGDKLLSLIAVVAFALSTVVGSAIAGHDLTPAVVISLAIAMASLVFGAWVDQIITQSRERAELIAELEASREEVARLSMEAGVAAERQRLAADIHDTLAQGFGSIAMLVQAVRVSAERDPSAVDGQLDLIERTARDNLAEARAMVAASQPLALQSATITEAIRRMGGEYGATVRLDGEPRPLPPPVAVVLLRACQEALTNTAKHAAARSVHIGLSFADDAVRLSVADDGTGFDPAECPGGFGLTGMRGRCGEVGGSLSVASSPGAGTTVVLEVPA